jgi:hypothetical protein
MGREFVKLKINIAKADFKDRLFIGSVSLKKDLHETENLVRTGKSQK